MSAVDTFLIQYGLAAVTLILFLKASGIPIPIPADLLILASAVRAAQGKLVLWQLFLALSLALVLGGLIQFWLARGPGRAILYRFGKYVGLTPTRLDAATSRLRKRGVVSVSLAILVPGVRGLAIAGAGLANLPLRVFVSGLILGSVLFLTLHLVLGYLGGSLLTGITHFFPSEGVLLLVAVLFIAVYVLWAVASRWQKKARLAIQGTPSHVAALETEASAETSAGVVETWHEGICPVCLALYTAAQLRSPLIGTRGA